MSPVTEGKSQPPGPAGVSMRELLAACAAADVISTPPRTPEPTAPRRSAGQEQGHGQGRGRREAA
jgi:hypothetical protein